MIKTTGKVKTMKLTHIAAALALAGGLVGGLATSASASTSARASVAPPTIKITGAFVSTQPGYYPTPAGPVIQVQATAKFDKHGVKVTDILLLVDGRTAPTSTGVVDTTYFGELTWWTSTVGDSSSPIPGNSFKVSPGKHVLVNEIIGVNGKVLAKSAPLTVEVPKQEAAVQPKLTYTVNYHPYTDHSGWVEITIHSATDVTLDTGTHVLKVTTDVGVLTATWYPGNMGIGPGFGSPVFGLDVNETPVISSMTLDGIPVTKS